MEQNFERAPTTFLNSLHSVSKKNIGARYGVNGAKWIEGNWLKNNYYLTVFFYVIYSFFITIKYKSCIK